MEDLESRFSSKALEDFELIDRAVGGDDKAFAKLLQRYKRPVYHMILKMVRNVDDAEDLMIESFAKAFRSLPTPWQFLRKTTVENTAAEQAFDTWLATFRQTPASILLSAT